jgi:hypothetical protein
LVVLELSALDSNFQFRAFMDPGIQAQDLGVEFRHRRSGGPSAIRLPQLAICS